MRRWRNLGAGMTARDAAIARQLSRVASTAGSDGIGTASYPDATLNRMSAGW